MPRPPICVFRSLEVGTLLDAMATGTAPSLLVPENKTVNACKSLPIAAAVWMISDAVESAVK